MEAYDEFLKVNRRGKMKYCENFYCEGEATTKVRVSGKRAGDSVRYFCDLCAEVYTIGVQHGTFRTLAEVRAKAARRSNGKNAENFEK